MVRLRRGPGEGAHEQIDRPAGVRGYRDFDDAARGVGLGHHRQVRRQFSRADLVARFDGCPQVRQQLNAVRTSRQLAPVWTWSSKKLRTSR
ncbi:hypothetical protein GCM10017567_24990 [Amycolatopsis bullii]|uniref:Transposase n=1 Tax=Amycolatopsis bullii TaxID=941987 RepID=A0ABQ3K895_9PSEU|nr:hypothetical protein GCM10017567_24990 [Amycolatopsis bullii]